MNKIARFFEEHVEKMVLAVAGLICAWLLITHVIFSPNMVEVGERKLSPSAIDTYVNKEAQTLKQGGSGTPQPMPPYEPRLPEFAKLLDSAIEDIGVDPDLVAPPKSDATAFATGVYRLPEIGEVTDVGVNLIRAVAYQPTDEVTPENMYDKAGNEPNDLDLVSVEAKFDVERLYDNFSASFFDDVEEMYADPCYAKPIFAKVQLQRQQLTDDGSWSDWQEVPRARIDHNRELFNIGEKVDDLPAGGLKVLKLQFAYKQMQIDLLQPQPYQFASAREEWFPPSLYDEYAEFQRKERSEQLRKEKEDAKDAREREREQRSGRRSNEVGGYGVGTGGQGRRGGVTDTYGGGGALGGNTRNRSRSRDSQTLTGGTGTGLPGETGGRTRGRTRGSGRRTQSQTGDYGDQMYGPSLEGLAGTVGTQRGPRRPTVNDVYRKYDEIALSRLTDFSKIREPLMFWAHDDTVEPEKTYRYRIRLGVFNPVAGTNQLDERDKARAGQAILWSGFSETTKPVEVMGRMYFFANNVHEANKTVTVQVARLALGHWYSQDFPVRQGELVGKSVEYEPPEPDRRNTLGGAGLRTPAVAALGSLGPGVGRGIGPGVTGPGVSRMASLGSQNTSNVPEYIDYATGAVMVDAVRVSDWSPGKPMRERLYYDMLYSFDGANIMHMPIGRQNWPQDLVAKFGTITKLEREPQEPFKSFGQGGAGRRTDSLGGYGDEMMYEDGYYDDMGGMY